jgi:predicted O-methyltransferase YrrM
MIHAAYRLFKAFLVSYKYAKKVFRYAVISKETATFTYNLTPLNQLYLMNLVAQITKRDIGIIESYCSELEDNQVLRNAILHHIGQSPLRKKKDIRCDYGNKLALYAIVRTLKPAVVVENGVEMGFTSIVLCEAIRKNIEDGYAGKFVGLDINSKAGYLVKAASEYGSIFEIRCGDAIAGLQSLEWKIDFYFSDGFRTYEYEQHEFAVLSKKLNENAIVITNKATFSKALFELSLQLRKKYSFFKEHPQHWYEGSGIGVMHS